MAKRIVPAVVIGILVLGLLLSACGQAASPSPTKGTEPTKAATVAVPTTGALATPTKAAAAATPTVTPKMGGTLTYIQPSDSAGGNSDVHRTKNRLAGFWWGSIYESLLAHDIDSYKIIPRLAERYEVAGDGLSITLYIRKGVKWHNVPPVNGREFTSADVKWNIEHIRDLNPAGVKTPALANVKDVETPDKYTAKLIFKQPDASIFFTLSDSTLGMMPPEYESAKLDTLKVAIGTGPFMLKSYEPNVSLVMVKNPDYWEKGLPRVDSVKVVMIADPAAKMAAMRTGQADVIGGLISTDVASLKGTVPDMQFFPHEGVPFSLRFNLNKKPLDDLRVRKALSLFIDKQELIKLVMQGDAELMDYFRPDTVPTGVARPASELLKLPGYRQPKDQDVAEAKKLLAEAGFANGLKLDTSISTALAYLVTADELLKERLKTIGVDWSIAVGEYTAFQKNVDAGDYVSCIISPTGGDADVVSNFYLTNGSLNKSGWGSAELDKLWAQGRVELNEAKRTQIYVQARDKMSELINEIPLWTGKNFMAVRPGVKEMRPVFGTNMTFFHEAFKYAWIEK